MTGPTTPPAAPAGAAALREALTARLAELVQNLFGSDAESLAAFDLIRPLLGPLVSVAVSEGLGGAQTVLDGLLADGDTYPAWQAVITAATPAQRIEIMTTAQQAALAANLKEAAHMDALWTTLKTILETVASVAALLL